ncbi:MAG: hypothetical protein PWP03_12 [Candidatus Woesearchaeota archaeon]|nr:hypothetical protein [Candidatus Woesearchaeota archaeon]MDN5327374.1 hypothetical protein [Candidatus Woesearchaeota archaeon]
MVFKHKDKNESIDKLVDALDKVYEHFEPENQGKLIYHEFDAHMNSYKSVMENLKLNEDGKLKEEDVDSILEEYLLNFVKHAHGERGHDIVNEIKKLFEEQGLSYEERFEYLSKVLPQLTGINAKVIQEIRAQLKNTVKYSKYSGEDFKKEFSYHLHNTIHNLLEQEHPLVNLHNSKVFEDYILSVPDYYHPGVVAEALKKRQDKFNLYIKDESKAKGLLPQNLYQLLPAVATGRNLSEEFKEKYGLSHEKPYVKNPEN